MKRVARIMKLLDRHLDGEHLKWQEYQRLIRMLLATAHNAETKLELEIKQLKQRIENLKVELNANNN